MKKLCKFLASILVKQLIKDWKALDINQAFLWESVHVSHIPHASRPQVYKRMEELQVEMEKLISLVEGLITKFELPDYLEPFRLES